MPKRLLPELPDLPVQNPRGTERFASAAVQRESRLRSRESRDGESSPEGSAHRCKTPGAPAALHLCSSVVDLNRPAVGRHFGPESVLAAAPGSRSLFDFHEHHRPRQRTRRDQDRLRRDENCLLARRSAEDRRQFQETRPRGFLRQDRVPPDHQRLHGPGRLPEHEARRQGHARHR